MPSWNHTEGYAFVSVSMFTLASIAIACLLLKSAQLTGCFGSLKAQLRGVCCKTPKPTLSKIVSRSIPIVVRSGARTNDARTRNVLNCMTYASCALFLMHCVCVVVIYSSKDGFKWLPWHTCKKGAIAGAMIYGTAKNCMYSVFVARLYAFNGSIIHFNKWTIRFLSAMIILAEFVIFCMPLFYRGSDGVYYKSTAKNAAESNVVNECSSKAPLAFWIGAGSFDASFTISVVYLFVSHLICLIKDFKTNGSRQHGSSGRERMVLLPLKMAVISSTAVLSTLLSFVLMATFGAGFLSAVDSVVNCAALVLMTKPWEPIYVPLCTPLLRCVVKAPCLDYDLELINGLAQTIKAAKHPTETRTRAVTI